MKRLFWLCGCIGVVQCLFAQLSPEFFYGQPSRYQSLSDHLALPDEHTLNFWTQYTDDPARLTWWWERISTQGEVVATGGYGSAAQHLRAADVVYFEETLYVLGRRQRVSTASIGAFHLFRFALDGTLLEERPLELPEGTFPREMRLLRTQDGDLLLALSSGAPNAVHLQRYTNTGELIWQRQYSGVLDAGIDPLSMAVQLHEWSDGSTLAVVPFRGVIGLYHHHADGTLLRGVGLDGRLDAPRSSHISQLQPDPQSDTLSLLGFFSATESLYLPGRWRIWPDGSDSVPELLTDTSPINGWVGYVRAHTDGGYQLIREDYGKIIRCHISADWALEEEEIASSSSRLLGTRARIFPSGRIVLQPFDLSPESTYGFRAIGPANDVAYERQVPVEGHHREEGELVRECPNGELLVVSHRSVGTTNRVRPWLVWTDAEGRFLRELALPPEVDAHPLDMCVRADGSIYLICRSGQLVQLNAAGEWQWSTTTSPQFDATRYLIDLGDQGIFFLGANHLFRINAAAQRLERLTHFLPQREIMQGTYFGGAFWLIRTKRVASRTVFYLQQVAPTTTSPVGAIDTLLVADGRLYLDLDMTATADSVHLLLQAIPSTGVASGGFVPTPLEEWVFDTSMTLVRRTPLADASTRRIHPAPDGGTLLVSWNSLVWRRPDGERVTYSTNGRNIDAQPLRDGRVVVTGGSGFDNRHSNLYLGFTPVNIAAAASPPASVVLYPNPSNGHFYWRIRKNTFAEGATAWQLYDATGRLLRTERFAATSRGEVVLRGLPGGLYHFVLLGPDQRLGNSLLLR